jgi:hypothetical protein
LERRLKENALVDAKKQSDNICERR